MHKAKMKLLFNSVQDIWDFVHITGHNYFNINTTDFTLICDCSEEEEKMAITVYAAKKLPLHDLTIV